MKTYGRLTVLTERRHRSVLYWTCLCTCGKSKEIAKQSIVQGLTKSCGCLNTEARRTRPRTHGMTRSRTYNIWCGMVKRCRNVTEPAYRKYGGRGITVCARWRKFENFLEDMGVAPDDRTLDRIDNDGNYQPSNCRWATSAEQARNRSKSVRVTFKGETLCVADWADRFGLKASTLYAARERGADITSYFPQEVR